MGKKQKYSYIVGIISVFAISILFYINSDSDKYEGDNLSDYNITVSHKLYTYQIGGEDSKTLRVKIPHDYGLELERTDEGGYIKELIFSKITGSNMDECLIEDSIIRSRNREINPLIVNNLIEGKFDVKNQYSHPYFYTNCFRSPDVSEDGNIGSVYKIQLFFKH
jgi:hypothetical protein